MSNNSFSLPPLVGETNSTHGTTNNHYGQSAPQIVTHANVPAVDATAPSSKDYIFAGAILLVLAIVFFFTAQQFSNHLVKKKHKPSSANNASIWLFFLLFDISVIAVIGIFDAGILSLLQVSIPLAVLALVFFTLLIMATRR